jgi:DNA-binding protein H-NS
VDTYDELKAQIERLTQEAEVVRQREMAEALSQIRAIVTKYDIEPEQICQNWTIDLGDDLRPRAPLYRDPQTGQTWSGRGRAPKWMANKPREVFRIDPPSTEAP